MTKFTGIIPALVTPLKPDESLNRAALTKLVTDLVSAGADGFYVGGATGEGIALRREVREELAEGAIAAAGDKPCIIHIASTDFKEATALAKHAEKCGAAGISAIPPLFFSYSADDVYHYYKALAEAVHIPLMIYYNPAAGFKINAEFAARAFQIDNVTAIKWTSSDYFGMLMVKELTHGEMNVINGPDEMLLMGLSAGADGGIGTTYNFMFDIIKEVYDRFRADDIDGARRAQTRADKIINALFEYNIIPATKVILEKQGYAVGNAAFPLTRYTEEEKERICAKIAAAGLVF
ncbi:MAG: dihydrodipicolinate synthase family protein [Eubacteriales bacterium]